MNTSIAASVILLLAVSPLEARAADAIAPAPVVSSPATPARADTVPARHHRSTVHDVHGQRFDVPRSLLRDRDTLINGLPPQPAQFD